MATTDGNRCDRADDRLTKGLDHVVARIAYLATGHGRVGYRVWPPSSGRPPEAPPKEYHDVRIHDCRPIASLLDIDETGFMVRQHPSAIHDFYDEDLVCRSYLPEVERMLVEETGAHAVFAFDHNVRSAKGAAEGRPGVRAPVDMAHNDYTEGSGPRRTLEILEARGRSDLAGHDAALVNVWRPIRGPVQDIPLTICEASSTAPADFVDTDIEHYGEDDLSRPRHVGQILSARYSPAHRWFYLSDMRTDEILVFKCWASARDGRARYTAHTGFKNPAAPPDAPPRESIEVRTVVVFPNRRAAS
jgi:hypothetical protein